MPKPRHDNPHAERQISTLGLARWQSRGAIARQHAAAAEAEAKRERERAELAAKAARAAELAAEARRLERRARRAWERAGSSPELRRHAAELATEAATADRAARQAACLVPVPWSELSPAELAWRWMLNHHHEPRFDLAVGDYVKSDFSRWCDEVRAKRAAEKQR